MKQAVIAASVAAPLICAAPALAHTHHSHHYAPKHHYRVKPQSTQRFRVAPTPRYHAPIPPQEPSTICVFGHWCSEGMFDHAPVVVPLVQPRAKLRGGINRQQFRDEIAENPDLIVKLCHMVFGEVGRNAPLKAKIVQLETAFNRAQARGQTLEHVLLSVKENKDDGYYAVDTYSQFAEPTPPEVEVFGLRVLTPVLDGSNLSDVGYGPMTGNASANVAAHQFAQGTPGYHLEGGDSYFREGPFINEFPTLEPTMLMVIL